MLVRFYQHTFNIDAIDVQRNICFQGIFGDMNI